MRYRHSLLLVIGFTASLAAEKSAGLAQQPGGPLKMEAYSSLTPGIKRWQARSATKPMLDLLQERLKYPIQFEIVILPAGEEHTPQRLFAFGAKLKKAVHLACVWGVELGWLRQRYPELNLQALVVAKQNVAASFQGTLLVNKELKVTRFAQLQNRRLVRYRGAPLMNRCILEKMIGKDRSLSAFFSQVTEAEDVIDALDEVKNGGKDGGADCVLVDAFLFKRLQRRHPRFQGAFDTVREVETHLLPLPAIIGSPEIINRLQRGLWRKLQRELCQIHESPEGRKLVNFWRFYRFEEADAGYHRAVDKAAAAYSLARSSDAGHR